MHHLLIFFLGHGLRHILVDFINELGTMLYHLVHRAVLQEVTVLIAILAVVIVRATVCVQ